MKKIALTFLSLISLASAHQPSDDDGDNNQPMNLPCPDFSGFAAVQEPTWTPGAPILFTNQRLLDLWAMKILNHPDKYKRSDNARAATIWTFK